MLTERLNNSFAVVEAQQIEHVQKLVERYCGANSGAFS